MTDELNISLGIHESLLTIVNDLIQMANEDKEKIGYITNPDQIDTKIQLIINQTINQEQPKNDKISKKEVFGEPKKRKKCKKQHDQS